MSAPKKVPYTRMVFVCTNTKEDGAASCGPCGAQEILDTLKDEVKKRGLKGRVRALKSGCMDICVGGPHVMVFPENEWYSGVTMEDVPSLVEKYLKKD